MALNTSHTDGGVLIHQGEIEIDVEQPVFGANFLKGKVRAQQNGNWRGESKFKIVFKAGGAIDFAQGMMRAIALARQVTSQNPMWNEPPPCYTTAAAMPAPTNYYATSTTYYGWTAPNYNFPPPEAGTVFVTDNPPPYPGLGTTQQAGFVHQNYIPQAYGNGTQAFVPPPPYSQAVPNAETTKKYN